MAPVWIVIKVKFGDKLRRFNALIHNEEFNFDMAILREKICSLFDFTPDVDFTLTYVDEDGDVVTLCDDDDLHDVASQCLDPLRITINLNTENLGGSSFTSSETVPFDFSNSKVREILKFVPEHLHDWLLEVLIFLASETENSTVPNELAEKLQTTHLNKPSEPKDGLTGASDIKEQEGFGPFKRLPMTCSEELAMMELKVKGLTDDEESADSKNTNVAKDVEFGELNPPRNSDLNAPYLNPVVFPYLSDLEGVNGSCSRSFGNLASSYDDCGAQLASEADSVLESKKKGKQISIEAHKKSVGFGASNPDYLKRCLQDSKMPEIRGFDGTLSMKETNDSGSFSSCQQGTSSGTNECPFKGVALSSGSIVQSCPYASRIPPFKNSYNHGNGLDSLFHTGVQCDCCGVYPITVPHFKSKVKDGYHLCRICFEEAGCDADFIKIDHPVVTRNSLPVKGFQNHVVSIPIFLKEHSLSKLDSFFVRDINVYDGTIMAPSNTFTKIWRMRNNGGVIWPQGSQFLWSGGDWLSNTVSVEVEVCLHLVFFKSSQIHRVFLTLEAGLDSFQIPAEGLAVGEEVDIAVDFTAPVLPGRYVSYWMMASPSGEKFGQLVWVSIEVDEAEMSIDLYMPPPVEDPEVVKSGMGHDSELRENRFARVVEPVHRFSSSRDIR
ncbi:hypothetical protein OSB04_004720 [Centaurea solstitialis]|uniref:ZZ-type domain-containing protein n=1 Tax=Centaurea solstitialis TaxID=347529 RepID=A0AA38TEM4_9ASTR|nr:hypothetical protein OSB04_004720 [Centaurea solstitialis]